MVRVVHVVLSLDPGGAERLVIELCERLRGQFEFAVCCLDERGVWADRLEAKGIEVMALGRQPGFRPALAWRIARYARRFSAHVLHCHEYSPFVYGTLAQLAVPGLRVISTEHGRLSDARATLKRRTATRLITWLPATVFAVSADLRRRLIDEGFPARRVRVILNGVDPAYPPEPEHRRSARSALSLGTREFVMGAVGRLARVKDFGTLLTAFAVLRRDGVDARLVILGEGPERVALTTQARSEGSAPFVSMPGHRDDVSELLPAFDVFVNSSTYEGISLTILEAMSAGLPVVATRVGGNPEVVDEGATGLLVPARAPDVMAASIRSLMDDDGRRRDLGSQGRRRVIEAFQIERMVTEYADVYRSGRPD